MTYEEAKEAIVNPQTVLMVAAVRHGKRHAQEVFQKVLEALDKQIPTEHHHTRVKDVIDRARESVCPSCLGVIITAEKEYPQYCTWCGQAIDWKREKSEDYFTPEQVRKMSREEVRKNYGAILKSMEKWGKEQQ